jgi:hypothetical protein
MSLKAVQFLKIRKMCQSVFLKRGTLLRQVCGRVYSTSEEGFDGKIPIKQLQVSTL